MKEKPPQNSDTVFVLALMLPVLLFSGFGSHYPQMWLLEVSPVFSGMVVIYFMRKRFPLSRMLLVVLSLFVLIHLMGAHYSHSEVPFGNWLQEYFSLERNPFDRIAHLAQGAVAAIFFREILVRSSMRISGSALFLLVSACSLAFAALYELLEFGAWSIILLKYSPENVNILGAQGDMWDTQWDMLLCLVGAVCTLRLLAHSHDTSLHKLLLRETS